MLPDFETPPTNKSYLICSSWLVIANQHVFLDQYDQFLLSKMSSTVIHNFYTFYTLTYTF